MVFETQSHRNGSPLRPGGEGRRVEDEEPLCGWVCGLGPRGEHSPKGEGVTGRRQQGGGNGRRGTQPQGVGRSRAQGWGLPHIPLCLWKGRQREPRARSSAGEGTGDETAGAEAQLSLSATGDVRHGAARPSSPSRGLRIRPPPARGSRSSSSAVQPIPAAAERQQKQPRSFRYRKHPSFPIGSPGAHEEPPATPGAAGPRRDGRQRGQSCRACSRPRGRRPCAVPGLHLLRPRP